MNPTFSIVATVAIACLCFLTVGCDEPSTPQTSTQSTSDSSDHGHGHEHGDEDHQSHQSHDDHGHGSHVSPRGGQIIELGRSHKYHAEMIDNHDDNSITVFILDGELKNLKIDAPTISLTLISGDQSKTFELESAGKPNDQGASFTVKDHAAFEMIETEGTEGKLRVSIDGKPYTGTFMHRDH